MPAIDPEVLTQQVEELAPLFYEPEALRSRLLDLFAFYADRTRRPGAASRRRAAHGALEPSRPVMRAIRIKLLEWGLKAPNQNHLVADALWAGEVREARLLAAALLGQRADELVPDKAHAWYTHTQDRIVQWEIVETGLAGLRHSDPATHLQAIAAWSQAEDKHTRRMSLNALTATVMDREFENFPALLDLLENLQEPSSSGFRRDFNALLDALTDRSPAETTHFLMAVIERDRQEGVRMARHVLKRMPEPERSLIRDALLG